MKILQINTVCGRGSTGKIAFELAAMLEANCIDSRILYGIGTAPDACARFAQRMGSDSDVRLHSALSQLFDAEGLGSRRATREAIRWIRGYAPDLIHLHNLHGCYLHYPLLFDFLKSCGRPVIWTLHDCWPFTGHCAHFDYAGCMKWQTACRHCPQSRIGYPRNLFLDRSAPNFARKKKSFQGVPGLTLVCPSQWLAGLVSKSFLAGYDTRVIVNGVQGLRPSLQPESRQELLLLAVSSGWHERKGLHHLQRLASMLDEDSRLVVIGSGSEQARVNDRVHAIARTENAQELYNWYARADVLVNPTLEDNMPLVNLEALACGTPVAAFHTGGIAEIISPSVGGVVPKGDVPALLRKALETAARKPALTEACLARAREFSAEKCHQQYLDLYEELLR